MIKNSHSGKLRACVPQLVEAFNNIFSNARRWASRQNLSGPLAVFGIVDIVPPNERARVYQTTPSRFDN